MESIQISNEKKRREKKGKRKENIKTLKSCFKEEEYRVLFCL